MWSIPTRPYPEAHFAVYPPDLIETPIKAGCPECICRKCRTPRLKVYKRHVSFHSGSGKAGNKPKGKYANQPQSESGSYDIRMGPRVRKEMIGYKDCGCDVGFEPGVVLDPFMGAGTTALVALKLGRHFVGIELNTDYIELAYRRIEEYLEQFLRAA